MPEPSWHLTGELLGAAASGELPPRVLVQIALEHLEDLCPTCREELAAWKAQQGRRPLDDQRLLQILPVLLDRHLSAGEREERKAQKALHTLLRSPEAERENRILRSRTRFGNPALVRLLIRRSREEVRRNPEQSLHFAKLARTALLRTPSMPGAFELLVLASAQMANSHRLLGNPHQAAEWFAHARYLIRKESVTDSSILARVDDLEASLLKDRRQLREAENLLIRAALLYKMAGSPRASARVLMNLGNIYLHEDRLGEAVEAMERALRRLDPDSEPRLYLCARYNLALYLTRRGKPASASALLTEDEALYRRFPEPSIQLRLSWLQGDIAALTGDAESAERLYRKVRNGFLHEKALFDAAIVSLDLALLYLQEGRGREVQPLAEEMIAVFEAEGVHREALAALILFRDAARQEALSTVEVLRLSRYFRDVRDETALRFSPGQEAG